LIAGRDWPSIRRGGLDVNQIAPVFACGILARKALKHMENMNCPRRFSGRAPIKGRALA